MIFNGTVSRAKRKKADAQREPPAKTACRLRLFMLKLGCFMPRIFLRGRLGSPTFSACTKNGLAVGL
jgi:hypothetical protein